MKSPIKVSKTEQKVKNKIDKNKKEQVLVVAQEIKFARLLSGNENKKREKVLKTLKKWLSNCFQKNYEFKEDDFIRVWKGLFYAVWMSDKPLIQEDLCENIAAILDQFPPEQVRHALLMTKAGFKVLATEWYGIDHHRMDKFLMLARRYLRGSLRCLRRCDWSLDSCQMFAKAFTGEDGLLALRTPHYARNSTSLILHILDCYMEELSKVSYGKIPEDSVVELVRPLCEYIAGGEALVLCVGARRALTVLLRNSEPNIQYEERTRAWQKMGCPNGGPEALELVVDDDENRDSGDENNDNEHETKERPLDPRAGRVNVFLDPLPVPAAKIAEVLKELLKRTSSKAYKRVKICMDRFNQLAAGAPPLLRDTRPLPKQKSLNITKAAHKLSRAEKKINDTADELALRGLSRKHRKRLLAKSRAGMSIVDEVEALQQKSKNATDGDWVVEPSEPAQKKSKKDDTNKENQPKIKKIKKSDSPTDRKRKHGIADVREKKKQKVDRKKIADDRQKVKVTNGSVNTVKKVAQEQKKTDAQVTQKDSDIILNVVNKKVNLKKKLNEKSVVNGFSEPKLTNGVSKPKLTNGIVKITKKIDKNIVDKQKITIDSKKVKDPTLSVNKVKKFNKTDDCHTPKKVKFVLKNNSMQKPVDYYKSVRQSPSIPFDGSKKPVKTNLKPSTPSPINPFFKKKLKMK